MTTIKSDSTVSSVKEGERPTLAQVYNSYATRVIPARDLQRDNRKCVMQAEWAYVSLKDNELLAGQRKVDLEIMFVFAFRIWLDADQAG